MVAPGFGRLVPPDRVTVAAWPQPFPSSFIFLLCIIKLAAIERWPDSLLDTQGGYNREVAVIER